MRYDGLGNDTTLLPPWVYQRVLSVRVRVDCLFLLSAEDAPMP